MDAIEAKRRVGDGLEGQQLIFVLVLIWLLYTC
jgi:hypothetical protein